MKTPRCRKVLSVHEAKVRITYPNGIETVLHATCWFGNGLRYVETMPDEVTKKNPTIGCRKKIAVVSYSCVLVPCQ